MRMLQSRARSERGVSLLDTIATLGIMGVLASVAVVQIGTARRGLQGDGAMRVVMAQFNTAREMAITQRRNMELTFAGNNSVRIVRHDIPNGTTVLTNVTLEGGVRFALIPGIADTPDVFGNQRALSFGAATAIMFNADGTLIDNNGNPLNGTVFMSIANLPRSLRAVTVLGTTGRVRGYKWTGTGWSKV